MDFASSSAASVDEEEEEEEEEEDENSTAHPKSLLFSNTQNDSFARSKDSGGAYNMGDLDQSLLQFFDDQQKSGDMRPHTLNIFPSEPMHVVEPSSSASKGAEATAAVQSLGLVSPSASDSQKSSQPSMDLANPRYEPASASVSTKGVKREGNPKGLLTSGSEQEGKLKTPDPKTLRRLAQNREAARKSRLRKKAYVQQLESSRMRLTQLEQELQRARAQGFYLGEAAMLGDQGLQSTVNMNSDAAVFDAEYGRWVEEHHRITEELRHAVHDHSPENELRIYVDNYLAHCDQIIHLKSMIAKSDVFHLISGAWLTPAERLFMWIGGSRPSAIIKIIMSQIEPVSEQQLIGICGLQQSTQQAEEALSQGLEALAESLSETLISGSLAIPPDVNHYMVQMANSINKLAALEGFVRQADNLRHQTLHRLQQIMTTRQAARYFLAIAEYFHRLRALSSLWLARPRHEQL